MSIWENFGDVQVGDKLAVCRGRKPRRIGTVDRLTLKQFHVDGYGMFWKNTGKQVGSSDAWITTFCLHVDSDGISALERQEYRQQLVLKIQGAFGGGYAVTRLTVKEAETIAAIIDAVEARK